jgi:hypothetical protein
MSKPHASITERRAHRARLSVCLLGALSALALALAPAVARAEKLETLILTETNPKTTSSQPASSTKPLVIGRGDGVITTGIGFGGHRASAIASALNPNNEVAIYANAGCTGTPVATGTVGVLEGAGIPVEVSPDSTTTFYATESDPAHVLETSDCSTPGLTYWHSSTAPPTGSEPPAGEPPTSQPPAVDENHPAAAAPLPPRLRTQPGGPANDNTPRVVGTASGADSVKIFGNSSCSGAPLAKVSAAELAAGVELRVADNSTTDFTGLSVGNGKQSFCSPPATYIEDSTPPRTRITMGPGAKTRHRKVVFRFADTAGDPLGASFACKVDRGKWKACRSPFKLRHLSYRRHTLRVRGTDPIGNAEAKAAKRSFKVIH